MGHKLITVMGKPFCDACGMGWDLDKPCLMAGVEYDPEPTGEEYDADGELVHTYSK